MVWLRFLVLSLMLAGFLVGCAGNPLGIDDATWDQMSVEQRIAAQEQQATLDRERAEMRAAEARAREAEAAREAELLAKRRAEAGYGERVQCIIDQGELRSGSSWREIDPTGFDLVVGMPMTFDITARRDGRIRNQQTAVAEFDGLAVTMCRSERDRVGGDYCAQVFGTQAEFRRGLRESFAAPRFLKGRLRCSLVEPESHRRHR